MYLENVVYEVDALKTFVCQLTTLIEKKDNEMAIVMLKEFQKTLEKAND